MDDDRLAGEKLKKQVESSDAAGGTLTDIPLASLNAESLTPEQVSY